MFKFGPEWIRTLSNDGNSSTNHPIQQQQPPPPPPLQQSSPATTTNRTITQSLNINYTTAASIPRFAEHRYGREEMLSLYERESTPPQELQDFGNIFVRRKQPPLALNDNSEDDNNQRHWQRQNSGSGITPTSTLGLRGTEIAVQGPRGRGRQRQFVQPPPGPGQANTVTYHNSTRFTGRPDDSQIEGGRSFYSSWNERSNNYEPNNEEWNNQRRDFSTTQPHNNRWTDWRRPATRPVTQEEPVDDRLTRSRPQYVPNRRPYTITKTEVVTKTDRNSWRNKNDDKDGAYKKRFLDREWSNNRDRPLRRGCSGDGSDDNLPEWAVETTNAQTSGSFDSSGAFHAPKSGDHDDSSPPLNPLTHSQSHSSFTTTKSTSSEPGQKPGGLSRSHTQGSFNVSKNSSKKHVSFAKDEDQKSHERRSESPKPSKTLTVPKKQFDVTKINFKKVTTPEEEAEPPNSSAQSLDWWSPAAMFVNSKSRSESPKAPEIKKDNQPVCQDFLIDKPFSELTAKDIEIVAKSDQDTYDSHEEKRNDVYGVEEKRNDGPAMYRQQSSPTITQLRKEFLEGAHMNNEPKDMLNDSRSAMRSMGNRKQSNEHLNVPPLYDFANTENAIQSVLLTSMDKTLREQHQNYIQQSKDIMPLPDLTRPPPSTKIPPHEVQNEPLRQEPDYSMMMKEQELLRAMETVPVMTQQPPPVYPQPSMPLSTSSNIWYYQDPQGELQGPFDAASMALWYKSGFFNDELMVRRGCDLQMYPLGKLGQPPPFMNEANAAALPANFPQPFPGLNEHVNQYPVSQPPPDNMQQLQMAMYGTESRNLRLEGVLNVNTMPSPMPNQAPMLYYPPPSTQVMPTMVPPPIDILTKPIPLPAENVQLNAAEESMAAFLRHLNVPTEPQQVPGWNDTQADLSWRQNMFQQQAATNLWDPQSFGDMKSQSQPINLEMEQSVPVMSTPMTMSMSLNPPATELPQKSRDVFEEPRPVATPAESTYNIWNDYGVMPQNEEFNNAGFQKVASKKEEKQWRMTKMREARMKELEKETQSTVLPNPEEPATYMHYDPVQKYAEPQKRRPINNAKLAPWSAFCDPEKVSSSPSLSEIQKLEAQKKKEQVREQEIIDLKKITDMLKISTAVPPPQMETWSKFASDPPPPTQLKSLSEIQMEQLRQQAGAIPKKITFRAELPMPRTPTQQQNVWKKPATSFWEPGYTGELSISEQQKVMQKDLENYKKGLPLLGPNSLLSKISANNIPLATAVPPPIPLPVSAVPVPVTVPPPISSPVITPTPVQEKKQEKTEKPQTNSQPSAKGTKNKAAKKTKAAQAAPPTPPAPKPQPQTERVVRQPSPPPTEGIRSINPEELKPFDRWCAKELKAWKDSVDIPTFMNFLKDVVPALDVKDYIKTALGETPEAAAFTDLYLSKRSRLLQKNDSGDEQGYYYTKANPNEFQEVKGKNKKVKKNKMLKVDARILGFSTTASEDRINIGDIDVQ